MGPIVHLAASLLLLALFGYFVTLLINQLRGIALAQRGAELDRHYLRSRIEQIMDQRRFEKEKNELSWNGYRKFRVERKVEETNDVFSFYLTPHDRKALPPFLPGQYLTFQLNIPDALIYPGGRRADAKPVIRCYSLSDSPNHPDYYRVTIKKIPAPRDKPDLPPGLASSFFHQCLKEGDIVDVKAPAGQFVLDMAQQKSIVLIGGGIGLTPVLSMLNAVVESGSNRETWFFYGVRNRSEHIMKEHLKRLAVENPNIHLNVCHSDPTDQDAKGRDYDHAERVSVDLLKRLLPSNNYEFFICGPPPMMNQITQALIDWGVPEESIHFEAFGPATVKKLQPVVAATAPPAAESVIEITFAKSGKKCAWKEGVGSLLELAEANGVTIDFGCRAGNCGTCLTAIQAGEVNYLVDHGAKPEAGSCLACISVPRTSLVLDA